MPEPRPLIAISSCLLGENVRHDGGHKQDDWLVHQLGKWVKWVPICPEMEMGLGAPRESMRLFDDKGDVKLVTNRTGIDLTEVARKATKKILKRAEEADGFVLKKNSPSCGIERVKLYRKNGCDRKGTGMFTGDLKRSRPKVPMIEEGRLSDPEQREHFVTQIFAYRRWKSVAAKTSEIQRFHQRYKLLLMSHSPKHYQMLGNIAANSKKRKPAEIVDEYEPLLLDALAIPSTTKKRVNVIQHALGYFKKELSAREKEAISKMTEEFREGELSFLAALATLRQLLHRFPNPYLSEQLFFDPYPKALQLRRYL